MNANKPLWQRFFDLQMNLCWMSVICLFFGFQGIADVTYCAVTKKHFNPFRVRTLLDTFIFFAFLINIFVTLVRNWWGSAIGEGPQVRSWQEKSIIYCFNYATNLANERLLLTLGLMMLWVRVVNFFRFNEYMGKFIGVVRNLIPEVILFFILYLINILIFSLIASVSFKELAMYSNFTDAFQTNFFASFGTFDFEAIEKARLGKAYGITFLVVFLAINIGLFMSLFVAITTALFQFYQEHENVYQMIETLKVRSVTQADKNYSVLISMPPPLNFILLFVAPCLLTAKNPQKINETLLIIAYIPILVGSVITWLIGEILMWPFVYVKMFFHKLTMVWVYSKSYRVSRADKFANFITYVIIGPVVIVLTTVFDTVFFLRHLIQSDL